SAIARGSYSVLCVVLCPPLMSKVLHHGEPPEAVALLLRDAFPALASGAENGAAAIGTRKGAERRLHLVEQFREVAAAVHDDEHLLLPELRNLGDGGRALARPEPVLTLGDQPLDIADALKPGSTRQRTFDQRPAAQPFHRAHPMRHAPPEFTV